MRISPPAASQREYASCPPSFGLSSPLMIRVRYSEKTVFMSPSRRSELAYLYGVYRSMNGIDGYSLVSGLSESLRVWMLVSTRFGTSASSSDLPGGAGASARFRYRSVVQVVPRIPEYSGLLGDRRSMMAPPSPSFQCFSGMPYREVRKFSSEALSQSASATMASGDGAQVATTRPRSSGAPVRTRPVLGTPLRPMGGKIWTQSWLGSAFMTTFWNWVLVSPQPPERQPIIPLAQAS